MLLRIEDEDKRSYYIEEACNNNWSSRQLERQINSQLYERLLLSNEKAKVLAVARKESQPEHPKEIIKDPMILEFLGLKPQAAYYEKDLENALISNMQTFLLELGNGFSFVARQKRIQIEDDEFKDFELLVSLGVFNSALMNDAVYKFKRYEDASLEFRIYRNQ